MTGGHKAAALLRALVEMSDEAKKLGGATSIAGVASLHKLQASIQKNRPRIDAILEECRKEIGNPPA